MWTSFASSAAACPLMRSLPEPDGCNCASRPMLAVAFSASANPTIGRAGVATAAGDDLGDAAAVFADLDRVVAIGVNCTAPSHVAPALERIAERTDRPLVAYPNGGGRWDPATGCWDQAGERITADMVASWLASGVRLLGGCCGFGPDALADLADLAGVQRRTR